MEKQKVIKIGLSGFEFHKANMGCEALTYSFLKIIGDSVGNKKIDLVFFNTRDNFDELKEVYSYINSVNTFSFPGKKLKAWAKMIKEMNSCVAIFDITYGDSFSDIYGKEWLIKTNLIKQASIWSKTPIVLLPQTYGPFKNPILKKWSLKLINKSEFVYSRDDRSAQYIRDLINKRILITTDVAFELPHTKYFLEKTNKDIHIGINVSGLLWCDDNNKFELKANYREFVLGLIDDLLKDCNNRIHIVPHVIDHNENNVFDNDLIPCKELRKIYGNDVIIEDSFKNAIEVKGFISSLDFFVGARMHSTIAAISTGVPTIPTSYSRKFEGLYESLNYDYVISLKEMSKSEAIQNILDYLQLKSEIASQATGVKKSADVANAVLREDIKRIIS